MSKPDRPHAPGAAGRREKLGDRRAIVRNGGRLSLTRPGTEDLHPGPLSHTMYVGVTGHLVGPLVFKTKERSHPRSLVGSIPIHSRSLNAPARGGQ